MFGPGHAIRRKCLKCLFFHSSSSTQIDRILCFDLFSERWKRCLMHREVLIYSDLDVTDRSSLCGKYSQRIARKAAVKFTHISLSLRSLAAPQPVCVRVCVYVLCAMPRRQKVSC